MGGLGICDPIALCNADFNSSLAEVSVVFGIIDGTSNGLITLLVLLINSLHG